MENNTLGYANSNQRNEKSYNKNGEHRMEKEIVSYEALGRRVRAKRTALTWTQERLANEIDVSTSFIGHIERGTRKASIDTLVALANAMQVSTDELLKDSLKRTQEEEIWPVRNLTSSQRAVMKQMLSTMQEQIENWDKD